MAFDINKYRPKNKRSFWKVLQLRYKLYKRKQKRGYEQKPRKGINFKQGIRRIVIVIIGFIFLCCMCGYIASGCIWDNWKFKENIEVCNQGTLKCLTLKEFLKIYDEEITFYNIECRPYYQLCTCYTAAYNKTLKNNQNIVIKGKKTAARIVMPSRLRYFLWQLFDFLLIPFWTIIVYVSYLLIEFVFIWMLQGFKQ